MANRPDHDPAPLGRIFLWLAAIGVLGGLTALFNSGLNKGEGQVTMLDEAGRAMVVLERDRSGHYIAEGAVNGEAITFLVDTGATDVALPERTARRLGLVFGPQVQVMTAAGPVRAWRTRLDRVTVGGLTLTNVRAMITRSDLGEALLGMSFLRHFELRQQGDRLIIAPGGTS